MISAIRISVTGIINCYLHVNMLQLFYVNDVSVVVIMIAFEWYYALSMIIPTIDYN